MKRMSTLLIFGLFLIVLLGSYTGYLAWKKASLNDNFKKIEVTLKEYENKMLQYEDKSLMEAISAKKTLANLEKDIIEWSGIIKRIRKTLPKDDGDNLVEVLSYSGSAGNDISMNVKTYEGRDNPYFDAADLIEAFDDSEYFTGNFVPSLAAGTDEQGNQILTFIFSTKYVEANALDLLDNEEILIDRSSSEADVPVETEVPAEMEVAPETSADSADLGEAIGEVISEGLVR